MAESISLFADSGDDKEQNQTYIKGKVTATFFESNDSFYKVILVKIIDTNLSDWNEDEVVITGNFADVVEDNEYCFYGNIVEHPKYGKQFKATNYESNVPTSYEGLVSYLSGDDFPGIGKKTASRVVDILGNNLIQNILNDSKVLNKVGLNNKQNTTIVNSINKNNGMEQVIIGLNSYGFGSDLSSSIYNKYKNDTLDVINENPYRLVEDINGIGFKKADEIASKIGMSSNNPARIRAGLISALQNLSIKNCDTYTFTGPIIDETLRLLNNGSGNNISGEDLSSQFIELARSQKIVGEDDRVYLKSLYDDEWQIAEHLNRIIKNPSPIKYNKATINKKIRLVEKKLNIEYDDSQLAALKSAVDSQMFLLTGGPGTGKTTIIKGIIYLYAYLNDYSLNLNSYKDEEFPMLLAAPTGRAAKRMNEATGVPASTIHRLLGLNGHEEDSVENTKDLDGGLLIIDEVSMVDTYLFKSLVRAIPNEMKVILVGDKDQLPSVGPGQVFSDLLNSECINSMHLNTIYRQDSDSTIIPLAHSIQQGTLPSDFKDKKPDRSFISCTPSQMSNVIEQIVTRAKLKGFTANDIQVLAPMYRGAAGVNHLNDVIQSIMNPSNPEIFEVESRGVIYREGDKVLQLVNSPENNVFNGDIGQIIKIQKDDDKSSNDKITIAFDQSEVTYKRRDWLQITLAYCTTIHKAQGSEFRMVILPIVPQFSKMLKKNLLYTAITRAEDALIMIGNYNSFLNCVENESDNRNTSLKSRIQKLIKGNVKPELKSFDDSNVDKSSNENDYHLTSEMIRKEYVDPMIGMQGIKP
ncbi:ATP-dependent RecD-like DNA helicase [Apilactobacillus apisilvae]|uniref:ATP-dependent RecD2 DNA helicase n=1 Tax=Apilactobacillus apisilvae TaxID=2923364 RepID=A0ABY4PJA1_9LACO|nr:ATP-dependent RecD-like DNA helicase [Apilactobacillus apisilvae]UQS85531.1 ATP-dependent RecD-like DNA helicase [Apilactobacillus apisilvae]